MKVKVKVLSLAIAAVLAGCGAAPEKETSTAPEASGGEPEKAAAAPAPEKKVEKKSVAAPAPEPEKVAISKPAPTPVKKAPAPKKVYKKSDDPNTFVINSEDKTKKHPEFGHGSKAGFVINGVEGGEIAVERGQNYKFEVDTGVQHDFYLSTNSAGWGAGTYSDGVSGQFIYEGEVTFVPGATTPDLLYYQCRNHKYMGGKIYVLDKGESLAKLKASLDAADRKAGKKKTRASKAVTPGAVKQKLGYAQMVIGSGSAKRVEASGNSEAIATLRQARDLIDGARSTLDGGDAAAAMEQVNEGLRMITAASRMITTESEMSGINYKAQYEELINSLKTYDGSYERNMKRLKKMGEKPKRTLDKAAYKEEVDLGKQLAAKGDHAGAVKSLENAQARITAVLTDMLHATTVVYDKNFETPKEEYEYELARLESYEELIPVAIEQKQPKKRVMSLIDSFVQKASKIKGEGLDVAAKGDHKMAIMAMQAATDNLIRALRMMGVN